MKKKKIDIMKNLNKGTPKLLRSLIENNDFNDISDLLPPQQIFPPSEFGNVPIVTPQEIRKKKSGKGSYSGHSMN